MGITIHYAGRAASEESIRRLFEDGSAVAKRFGWKARLPPQEALRTEGLIFLPHESCEPLAFRFSRTRRFSDFCKTQFAGPEVHVQVLQFLEHIRPQLSKLVIYDEADDVRTDGQPCTLAEAFEITLNYIKAALAESPGSQMQVRLPSGRIADLVG